MLPSLLPPTPVDSDPVGNPSALSLPDVSPAPCRVRLFRAFLPHFVRSPSVVDAFGGRREQNPDLIHVAAPGRTSAG